MNFRRLGRWLIGIGLAVAIFLVGPYLIPRRRRPLYHGSDLASAADRFVEVDGFRMRYRASGLQHTAGVPIVFLHGWAGNVATWHRNLPPLAESRRVYAIDLKGWGLTDKPSDSDYSLLQQAHHVRSFLRAMGEEHAVLVGHSMGGAIAIITAAEFPDAISGIVLINPAGGNVLSYLRYASRLMELPPLRRWALLAIQYSYTYEPLMTRGMPRAYYDPATHLTLDMKRALLQPYHTHGYVDAVISTARQTHHHHITARVPHIHCPTLIIWGANDVVLPLNTARYFLDSLPGARLEVLRAAGHQAHEEQSEAVNRLIADFAAELKANSLPSHNGGTPANSDVQPAGDNVER